VHHRKLKKRLANSHEWIEFEGTLFSQPLMGGYANVDDDVFEVPGGAYRGVAPRSFDAKSGQWSIWWMDSRTPLAPMDPPSEGASTTALVPSMPTIPRTGNQPGYDSYGLRSHPPHVTGSRRIRLMAVEHGKRIGYRISYECNSWFFKIIRQCARRRWRDARGRTEGPETVECTHCENNCPQDEGIFRGLACSCLSWFRRTRS
jgi:hypothetical protein